MSNILYFLPNEIFYAIEAAFIVIQFLFFTIYYLDKVAFKKTFEKIELIIFLAILLPFYTAFTSYVAFGQPMLFGILTKREYFLAITGLMVLYFYNTGTLTIKNLQNIILFLCWATFIYYVFLIVFVGAKALFEGGSGVVNYSETKGGYVFKFNAQFIVIGLIHYFVLFLGKDKFKYLIYVIILFAYLLFFLKARGLILAVAVTLSIYYVLNTDVKKKLFYGILLSLLSILLLNLAFLFFESSVRVFTEMFENIFLVLQGEETGENSADSRIFQVGLALGYLGDNILNWLFGLGFLSYQWNGGFAQLGYFFPTDIGIIGVIFVFGIFVFIASKALYFVFYRYLSAIGNLLYEHSFFKKTVSFYIIYYAIHSIQTGEDLFHAQIIIIFLFVTYCMYKDALVTRILQKREKSIELKKSKL